MTDPESYGDEMELDPNSVSQLVEKARQGDDQAREKILVQMRDYLELMANKHMDFSLQDKAGPSDLVQQSMAQVYEKIDQFRGSTEAEFRGWLKAIVINEMKKIQRTFLTGKRNVGRENSIQANTAADRTDLPLDKNLTPSSAAIAAENIQHFYRILDQLPNDYARVIRLRSIEQLAFEDIAQQMNRSYNAVTKLWYRAVLKFEELLRESGDQFASRLEES